MMAKDIVIAFLTKLSIDIENKADVDVSYSQQRDYFSSGKILGQPIYYVFKYFRTFIIVFICIKWINCQLNFKINF